MIGMAMADSKTCIKCNTEKHISNFSPTGGASGNLRKACDECRNLAKLSGYYASRDRINADRKAKYYQNRDVYLDRARESRVRCAKQRSDYKRQYNRANRDKTRQWNNNRRARLANAAGSGVTEAEIIKQFNRQRGACYYCQAKLTDYELDHMHPISRGGGHYAENTVVVCKSCNCRKWNKFLTEWVYESSKAKNSRSKVRS